MSVPVILDILVAGLLIATIGYAIVLNRRLIQLRGGREHMEHLINDFYQATARAESGISALKEVAGCSDPEIAEQMDALTNLRDELESLVARAETQRARLDVVVPEDNGPAPSTPPSARGTLAFDADLDAELFAESEPVPAVGQEVR